MAINVTQIANEITRQLRMYEESVRAEIDTSAENVGKELVAQLKQDPSPKLTGDYRKGWRLSKVGKRSVKYVVHNKTDYRLTHLLENGHVKVNGGRVDGVPHIRPGEERAVREFLDRVERAIRQ